MSRELRREAIRRTLVHRAGLAPDASAVAEAALIACQQVSAQLAPVIGARGVNVLFRRALHLASTAFPWLAMAEDHGDNANLFATIKARLAGREPEAAQEASHALLSTFTEMLATLIGESLAERLLGPVWASPSPAHDQENAS